MKIFVWLLLIVLIVFAIRKNMRASRSNNKKNFNSQMNQSSAPAEKPSEVMVCCANCQVYIPASEAIVIDNVSYCSIEHAQKAK
jgi:uncharacterized protein